MSPQARKLMPARFCEQLQATRDRISALPAAQRPYFQALADEAEQLHAEMQRSCTVVQDLVDDLSLKEAATSFNLWAAMTSMQRALATTE